jgi:hypothetical protein
MSESHGMFSALGLPIVDAIEEHRRLPPDQKYQRVVSMSAAALGWCAYLAPLGLSGDGVLFGLWAGGGAIALLSLIAAFKAGAGLRSPLAMLWRALLAAACVWLLWNQVYPDPREAAGFLLKGLYIGWLCANAARFLLAAGLWQRDALREIQKELQRQNAGLRPVRRR